MAERRRQEQSAADEWTISGKGQKPSLTFRVERNTKLSSEDDPKGCPPEKKKWTKDNPQPKYQYICEVTWDTWSNLFEEAKISTGWDLGKVFRAGVFKPNAHLELVGKKEQIVLNKDAEVIKIDLPLPKQARQPDKPLTIGEMLAEIKKRAKEDKLTDEDRKILEESGIPLELLK